MSLVDVKHISKIYGFASNRFNALDRISFQIEAGEFVGVMGPSGAGKSTLLNIVSTLDAPTSGTVVIDGHETTKMHESALANFRKEKMGFVFQDYSLFNNLNVWENIELPLLALNIPTKEIIKRVDQISKALLIKGLLDKYPSELSGGQKQRVAAARAIVKHPEIIFADEPTGSLDSKSATELLQFLSDLNRLRRATIMLVTHDAFTASYCNRILFIKDGQLFSEIRRASDRQKFFEQIIDMQSTIGGGLTNDF